MRTNIKKIIGLTHEKLIAWRRDRKGVALVEFALVLPVMLILFVSGVETVQLITANRKMATVAGYFGDMVAQVSSVSKSDLDSLYKIGDTVMQPFNLSAFGITVESYTFDQNSKSKKNWTWSKGQTPKTIPTPSTRVHRANTSLIVVQAQYKYTPIIGGAYGLSGTFQMSKLYYFSPRTGAAVKCVNNCK